MTTSARDLVLQFGAPLGSVDELLFLARRFVALLGPRPQDFGPSRPDKLSVFDEIAFVLESAALQDARSPLPNRMAFAVTFDSIQHRNVLGEVVDSRNLPLLRSSRLRRLLRSLNAVRRSAELIAHVSIPRGSKQAGSAGYSFGKYPALDLLDRCDTVLRRYLRLIPAAYQLTWKKGDDMPPALAGALTELLLEAWSELPALAGQIVLRCNAEANAEERETERLLQRVSRASAEGLRNPPTPTARRVLGREDLHKPAQFWERNLANPFFCDAANAAPAQLQTLLN